MLYTVDQLLQIYRSPKSGWIMVRNDDEEDSLADVSAIEPAAGAVDSDGVWKIHLSIAPDDMQRAIPIIREQFCHEDTPAMGMKIATGALLAEDHQSGKQVAFIFNRATEQSRDGQRRILNFLRLLAEKLVAAGIKPEARPPLTVETEHQVRDFGSAADKKNLDRGKYDAVIRFRESEALSYFNYRDEMALIFDNDTYNILRSSAPQEERQRMVRRSQLDNWHAGNHPEFKHNPLRRKDDFLYGVVLERDVVLQERALLVAPEPTLAARKETFINELERKLKAGELNRKQMLDFFAELKQRNGKYAFVHQQQNPRWDRIRLFFKSAVQGQDDNEKFWHTATYQKAVKLLKNAYLARTDLTALDRNPNDADALIDYVRGNSIVHFNRTSTRKLAG